MPVDVTSGSLLNGRVRYDQFSTGFRSGIEPVFLAASVPARAGELVLEAGCGAGAGLLCLDWRIPGVFGIGVERDQPQSALAKSNAPSRVGIVNGDIRSAPFRAGSFAHAFANPPYHAAEAGPPSPNPSKRLSKVAVDSEMAEWIRALASLTRVGGTVTLSVPAARVPNCLEAFTAEKLGSAVVFPLWPRINADSKLVLLRAISGARGPFRIASGLVLHNSGGTLSREADSVLRHGSALEL